MKKIFKYALTLRYDQELEVPEYCRFLSAAKQGDSISLWAMVDDCAPMRTASIRVVGTGHPCDGVAEAKYLGIVIDGPFVWHVFEV